MTTSETVDRGISSSPALFLLGTLELGGSEKKIVQLARRLMDKGYPVHVAYLRKPDPLITRLDGVPVIHLRQTGKYSIKAVQNLKAYILEHGIASLVTINLYPLLYAMPARQTLAGQSPKVLASVNTSEILSNKDRLAMTIYSRLLARTSEIVFGSERQRSDWVSQYRLDPGRCSVIYNGVDGNYFNPEKIDEDASIYRNALDIPADAVVIACVGKLRPEKGHLNLLKAMGQLQTKFGIDPVLVVVGDGCERASIENAADELGLTDKVRMIGNVDDVRPYLGLADVFALPSIAVETFSNAALEAAAMGLPVVISDVGGSAEMFEGQSAARIYPRDDVRALATALADIIDHKAADTTVRKDVRGDILERFSLQRMDEQWVASIWGGRSGA